MAATAPADSFFRATDRSGDKEVVTEFGMSRLGLVNTGTSKHSRIATDSTLSTSPPVDDLQPHHRLERMVGGRRGEERSSLPPSSPTVSIRKHEHGMTQNQDVNSLLSSFGKIAVTSGHQSNTSCTSPSLTLTPNSTDGSNFFGQSFQNSSSATDGPSIPQLHFNSTSASVGHHRRGETSSSFGSFDLASNHNVEDDDNDGLFGLEALHYRAASMHNPSTGSPLITHKRVTTQPPHHEPPGFVSQQRRTSSERPPLSHSYEGPSMQNNERNIGSMNFSSVDTHDSRSGYGTIGQLRQNAADFDPHRRRSSSQDNSHYGGSPVVTPPMNYGYHQESAAQKFGVLPSLSSHIHQQKSPFSDSAKPRHTRSISQPGPPVSNDVSEQHQHQPYLSHESHIYDGSSHNDALYNRNFSKVPSAAGRSASFSHQGLSSQYDHQYASSVSLPNHSYQLSRAYGNASAHSSSGHPVVERRESLEYHTSPAGSHKSTGSFIDGLVPSASYGGANSPAPSPHQSFYGSHSHVRQQSDNVLLMQSTPMGLGVSRLCQHNGDDALAGENIDVPEYDDLQGVPSYYFQGGSSGSAHPLLRGAAHSHSMSLDAIPSQYMDQHRSPQSNLQQQPKVVYAVKFKRSQRNFVLGPRISRDLKIGTYVKVEADRGEDLGIVVGKPPAEKLSTFTGRASFTAGMGPPPAGLPADLKRIMRLATHDEVSLLGLKRDEEEELLKICRAKVRQRGLPMNVVDAEYQFDRHKLTFFFEALGRVDFRELVRDLFSMYKTRIWMQQLDKNTSTSAQAIIAPLTANLQMDYGTPIIAPPSEFADSIIFHGMSSAEESNRSH